MTSSQFEARRPHRHLIDEMQLPEFLRLLVKARMYIRGPIALYRREPTPAAPHLVALAQEDVIPSSLGEYMTTSEQRLATAGFAAPLRAKTRESKTVNSYVSLLEHPTDGALAFIHVGKANKSDRLFASAWFHDAFVDGTIIATGNSRNSLRWPPRPGWLALRFTEIDDAAELYAVHRFRVTERSKVVVRVPMTRGDNPLAYEARDAARVHDHWVSCGYWQRLEDGSLRMTRKGATLSAWRGMFPWRELVERERVRETERVLARFRRSRGER